MEGTSQSCNAVGAGLRRGAISLGLHATSNLIAVTRGGGALPGGERVNREDPLEEARRNRATWWASGYRLGVPSFRGGKQRAHAVVRQRRASRGWAR